MTPTLSLAAQEVIDALKDASDPDDAAYVAKFYSGQLPDNRIMGTRMPKVFPIAKRFRDLPLAEIEKLLNDPHHEVRMAAMAILDFKARSNCLTLSDREAMIALYLQRHDRIDNWDHVDRAAQWVLGEAILQGADDCLDDLITSDDPNKRRSAIVATAAWLRRKDATRTIQVAEKLAKDPDPYARKALISWLLVAGKCDAERLARFLSQSSARLPLKTAKTLTPT